MRRTLGFWLLTWLGMSAALVAQTLDRSIEAALEAPAARRALWGIRVVEVESGRVLYGKNAAQPFTPASNMKLFTTAVALLRLGPDYHFETRVLAPARPDAQGRVEELHLVGGGDPTLSGRAYPYRKEPGEGDPLAGVEALAQQVWDAGVRQVSGDIIGDDTLYPWEPYPEGWTVADAAWEYGAAVSALVVNDNAFRLTVRPPRRGDGAVEVTLRPDLGLFTISNTLRVFPGAERKIEIDRAPGSRVIRIWGTAPPGAAASSALMAADDPAWFAAEALRRSLERRGVVVTGEARAAHRLPGIAYREPEGLPLATRTSPPLGEILRVIDKVSQNLHAEIVLRETARRRGGDGSRALALKELESLLEETGTPKEEYEFQDGSGLSRRALVSPAAITRLLLHLARSPQADLFRDLLPVAGADGTLASRFRGQEDVEGIRAKTGSVSHVATLSGLAGPPGPAQVAFSIMANQFTAPAAEVRAVIDTIAVAILRSAKN
jgi:D-alanyl-D-alanine carboxypeptidase/D-alanyl-D-alanine-endopeptidase (penicillin-binding protein 4)